MKYIASYLLLTLGGNASPSAADVKKVLDTVGIEAEDERLNKLISELEGKDIAQVRFLKVVSFDLVLVIPFVVDTHSPILTQPYQNLTLSQLILQGSEKLASVPSVGVTAAAPAAGTAGAGGAAAEEKKEEAKEEAKEVSLAAMGTK